MSLLTFNQFMTTMQTGMHCTSCLLVSIVYVPMYFFSIFMALTTLLQLLVCCLMHNAVLSAVSWDVQDCLE